MDFKFITTIYKLRLHLKTIVSLTPNPPNEELLEFCRKESIRNVHFSLAKIQDDVKIPKETMTAILEVTVVFTSSSFVSETYAVEIRFSLMEKTCQSLFIVWMGRE